MILLFIIIIAFIHRIKDGLNEDYFHTRFVNKDALFWNPNLKDQAKKIFGKPFNFQTVGTVLMILTVIIGFILGRYAFFFIKGLSGFAKFSLSALLYIVAYNLTGSLYLFKKVNKNEKA